MDATTICVDRTSRKGSVVDVAKMVLECDTDEAETACIKIGALPDEEQRRINGSGGLTAVAEVDMLVELAWLLPAEIPDYVPRQMSHTVCKLLKGDPSLYARPKNVTLRCVKNACEPAPNMITCQRNLGI